MCDNLYAGLEAYAQLDTATCCLCLVPSCPHNEFSQVPEERLPYPYGEHPCLFIKRH